MKNSQIPIGFRFEPTDEELVRGFLYPRVIGSPLPWNGVVYKPLYGPTAAPWEVFSGDFDGYWETKKEGGATKNITYVFTNLIRVHNSNKISRRAGGGTWGGQTGPKMIVNSDTGDAIGYMRMLSFEHPKCGASTEYGHWIMHEFVLSDDVLSQIDTPAAADMVVCKITRCVKNSGGKRAQPAISDVEETRVSEVSRVQEVQETVSKKQTSCGGGGGGGGGSFTEVAAVPEVDDSWLVSALEHDNNNGDGNGGYTEAAAIQETAKEDDSWLVSALEHAGNIEIPNGGDLKVELQSDSWAATASALGLEIPNGGDFEAATASALGFDDTFDIETLLGYKVNNVEDLLE